MSAGGTPVYPAFKPSDKASGPDMRASIKDEFDEKLGGSSDPKSWTKMNTLNTFTSKATEYVDNMVAKITGGFEDEDDLWRVVMLAGTLFFVVGGYWLLRTIKDPIMSSIDGVEYIPQAKIASLFAVFGLVIVYNKLLDNYPKHHVFYMMVVT